MQVMSPYDAAIEACERHQRDQRRATVAEARQQRAQTRRALQEGAAQERRETMAAHIEAAHVEAAEWLETEHDRCSVEVVYHRTALGAQGRAFHRTDEADHDRGSEPECLACQAYLRYVGAGERAAMWEARLAGFEPFARYVPNEVRTWVQDPTGQASAHVLVEDDDRLPEFTEIVRDEMDDETRERLDSIVSFMPNWCWEPAGVSEAHVIHRGRGGSKPRIEVTKPKEKRHYPGFHHIGVERDRRPGAAWSARMAVITVWLERRNRWAVYACYDGGRSARGFTSWQPFEWHLIEPGHSDEHADVQHWTLDRALEVAYLKAKRLKVLDGEWTEADSALPFDPAQLSIIADAQATEQERRRHGGRDDE